MPWTTIECDCGTREVFVDSQGIVVSGARRDYLSDEVGTPVVLDVRGTILAYGHGDKSQSSSTYSSNEYFSSKKNNLRKFSKKKNVESTSMDNERCGVGMC